jgi:hypothetical protein
VAKLTKAQRAELREKFGCRCACCGCPLPEKGWHADYVEQDMLEAANKRIAELEADELALIDERDSAEDVIAEMYEAATGNRPQWSSCFRFSDAVEDVAQVRVRLTTPGRLPAAKDTSQGWTIDPDYLSAIAEKVGFSEYGGSLSMETVEAVLLAAGFTVGDQTANVAPAEGQLVTAMGYQGGRNS